MKDFVDGYHGHVGVVSCCAAGFVPGVWSNVRRVDGFGVCQSAGAIVLDHAALGCANQLVRLLLGAVAVVEACIDGRDFACWRFSIVSLDYISAAKTSR